MTITFVEGQRNAIRDALAQVARDNDYPCLAEIVEHEAIAALLAEPTLPPIASIRKGDPVRHSAPGNTFAGSIAASDAFEFEPGQWTVAVRTREGRIVMHGYWLKVSVPAEVLELLAHGSEPSVGHPDLIDCDGDRWVWSQGYDLSGHVLTTRARIEEEYGPVRDA